MVNERISAAPVAPGTPTAPAVSTVAESAGATLPDVDLSVTLAGWRLDNPVIAAAGTFGYGREFADIYDINRLGTFAFKGTTEEARTGNPTPRIAEGRDGILFSIGLQNPGAAHVLAHELPDMETYFHKKVIANLAAFTVDGYARLAAMFAGADKVGILEINISCPNADGGAAFGTTAEGARRVTAAVRAVTDKPVFIKLVPDVPDITDIARACEDAGADGLTVANGYTGLRMNLRTGRPQVANGVAGYGGPAVFPMALARVFRVASAVHIPIIGTGGVTTAEDVLEMLAAGATAVGVGAANLRDPYACLHIVEDLPAACRKYGIRTLDKHRQNPCPHP